MWVHSKTKTRFLKVNDVVSADSWRREARREAAHAEPGCGAALPGQTEGSHERSREGKHVHGRQYNNISSFIVYQNLIIWTFIEND